MSAPGWFGRHAARLDGYGFDVIPISRHDDRSYTDPGKQPAQRKGWTEGCPVEQWPAFAACGVGILTKRTPALDIDVLDAELAESIQDIADRVLGNAPYRIGQPPKRLMPFRLVGEPFKKIKLSWRGLGAQLHPPDKPAAVELLTHGQQFVALGTHPATGKPYQWHRDPDLSLPHGLLPPLNQSRAAKFMRALGAVLDQLGATDIKLTGTPAERKRQPDRKSSRRSIATTDLAKEIEAALDAIGNNDLHYDDWIRIGHAIKAALPNGEGRGICEDWSAKSTKNDPALTRRKWATFDPHTISEVAIFALARRAGK